MWNKKPHRSQDIRDQSVLLQKKQRVQIRKRHKNDDTILCQLWECHTGCIPCITHLCPLLSEIQGKCETCKQQSWAVCLYDLHKIPSKLLV